MLSSGCPKQTHPSSIEDLRPTASSAAGGILLFGPFLFIVDELRAGIRLRGCQLGKARVFSDNFAAHAIFLRSQPMSSGGPMRKRIVRSGPPGVSASVSLTLGTAHPKRQTLIYASRALNWRLEFGHVNWGNRPTQGLA
ncbi:hypothetical protein DdX_08030 [Ditylenchus destructor]|uniref:Uncharacterized protein n=1 Tax=Ditylenchus destructor TaxID=166010 RepID=A0AAD4N417_9BILA|nr:hypothetical protein DdX_08030 [Ditylenchus destructor]